MRKLIIEEEIKSSFYFSAQGFQRGFQEADPTFNERNTRTKTWGMWPNDAGQVRRDRNMNRNSYHPESQPKHAFKTNLNLDKCGKNLHAYDLVEILAKKEDLNSSMLQVIRERNVNPDDVQTVLNNHGNIFHIKSDRFCLKPRLKLCAGHSSNNGCKNKTDCVGLHICQNFLEGICKYKACNLGHKLATGHNKKVLGNFFLDRLGDDTLLRVLSKSLPKSTSNSQKGSGDQRTRLSSPNRAFLETSESDAYSLNGDDDSDADHFCGRSKRKKPSPIKKKKQIQTVWSTDSNGDVEIPEICYNSVESSCPRQDEGCEKLHSFQHFYWQISKDNSKWFNLPPKLVLCLEKSYCDVSQDGVTLPRLKGVDLQSVHIDAVKILSRDEWTSDFHSMTLKNSNHKVQLHLRRLCSEKTDSANVKANTFCWYFRDDNDKWISYGNSEEQGQCNTATSENIEKYYLAKPSTPFNLKKQRFNYMLDFQKMCQINVGTSTRREIRRRPLVHLQETPDRSFLPEDWQDMQPKERMRLVDLDPKSVEYKKVVNLLKDDTYKAKVQKIQRNQNLHLWKAFQLRKEDMITQYGDEASVKMTDLFHGTNPDIVSNICKENFDFRLHGERTGHIWGKGLYFGNDITYCYNNCSHDTAGLKYLFVAKVLVGTITVGAKDLRRPPLNPATNELFDTTVDNETQPTIFVKYDKQEYYPYYLIKML
ncbi:protein mono-ADP-ribosyltransferase PARP12-like [Penaeus vannamei]|uniref:protein mono-ADP-ribosyltransferase PARP12-like n=1 Tax=Penaeus vannamei TaxID=6689 RepID=UPI00387F7FA1